MNDNKKKIISTKEKKENQLPNGIEIDDSSISIDSNDERPGIGYEIFDIKVNNN